MWTDLSSVLSQCTRVTDGQTDGQTDRILIARPRLHWMQRGKNWPRLARGRVKYTVWCHSIWPTLYTEKQQIFLCVCQIDGEAKSLITCQKYVHSTYGR